MNGYILLLNISPSQMVNQENYDVESKEDLSCHLNRSCNKIINSVIESYKTYST